MERTPITIYTTSKWPGHVVRLTGYLVHHGTKATDENPMIPFVTYRKDRKERTVFAESRYLIIIAGSCPLIPETNFDLINLPFPPHSFEWVSQFNEQLNKWLTLHAEPPIADFRQI